MADQSTNTVGGKSGFDQDFILGTVGQRSDNAAAADNWCDPKFSVAAAAITAGQELKAAEGFNVKTKCTWQLTALAGKAPQIALTSASNTSFFIQWIDSTAEAATDASILPSTLDIFLGKYDDGIYFNPYKQGLANDLAALGSGTTAGTDTKHNQPYNEFGPTTTFTNTLDASIGLVNYWIKDGNDASLAAENVDFNLFAIANAVMEVVYEDYAEKVDDYNDLATAYNTAFDNAMTDNTVVVPGIPCPPSLPTNGNVIDFEVSTTTLTSALQQTALNGSIQNDTIYYVPLNTVDITAGKAKYDVRRLGNLYTQATAPTTFTAPGAAYVVADQATWPVGHVYGRLGQGDMNMPNVSKAWRFDSTETLAATMDVSIFPEQGFSKTAAAFTATDSIVITASEASFTETPYETAKSKAKDAIITNNAIAMGLSVAALAVSASLY